MRTYAYLALLANSSFCYALLHTSFGQYPDPCPGKCSRLGPNPSEWMQVHSLNDLQRCRDQTLLFDLNVQNLVDNPQTQLTIRTCSRDGNNPTSPSVKRPRDDVSGEIAVDNNCGATAKDVKVPARIGSPISLPPSIVSHGNVSRAITQIVEYLNNEASCGVTIMFAKSGDAVVGLYSGAGIQKASAAALVKKFQDHAQDNVGSRMLQICNKEQTSAETLGLFIGEMSELAIIQNAVKSWTNGGCLDGTSTQKDISMTLLVSSVAKDSSVPVSRIFRKRAPCRDIQVVPGDSCGSLATRCGISGSDFTKFNPASDLCAALRPKQWVCCSAGELPDHLPQPNPNGSCFTHTVQPGDGCWAIADSFGIDQSKIGEYNSNTWGWAGCERLQVGQVICLSQGGPPFPPPVEGAVCGPQVPGTQRPTDGTPIAELNPCPLNACCDVWGFCGITQEFCTPTPADTGAPGTAQPGTNGCISNCGTDIVNNDAPPAQFIKVGYFEAWNKERPCLTMDVTQIDKSKISHIHFAFATVTADWRVDVSSVQEQFDKFKALTGVAKILSFGGWAFSTEPATFQRFRDATLPGNREVFATNCVDFLNEHRLDGLDFDWEYPGAPDIPGVPPGTGDEAWNYYEFLVLVRNKMVASASLSIAIPASFWYLKPYPVKEMATVLDYMVYMTYDFHGQWDIGNQFSIPGCPAGNCLRSHVNKTETQTALALITKAGVPSNKVIVGISSYGRGFRMSNPNCRGPMCTFTGTSVSSNTRPGRCTRTSGYISNAEMDEIIANPGSFDIVDSYHDPESDSDILVYGDANAADWVAYMSQTTKTNRAQWFRSLNFGGSVDWAVDLMEFIDENHNPNSCRAEDRTYSEEVMRVPQYNMFKPIVHATTPEKSNGTRHYITIVNMTPHRFVLDTDRIHSYQMKEFNWGDIPQGRSRQNVAHIEWTVWPFGNIDDSAGEAYYTIAGTNKRFEFRARLDHAVFDLTGMGLGERRFNYPGRQASLSLVISGSDSYGFTTSLAHGPGNWMRNMYDVIKDRKLKHIVMPGTHDAGMTRWTGQLFNLATPGNTLNQGLDIYYQLRAGARWFDLRVGDVYNPRNPDRYKFWVLHLSDEEGGSTLGNTGESFDEVIEEINRFTSENPGEIIFLRFRYLIGRDEYVNDQELPPEPKTTGPRYWDQRIVDHFFSELKRINNLCPNLEVGTQFSEQKASYFMDRNGRAGCVIPLLAGHLRPEVSQEAVGDGIYHKDRMEIWDNWSDENDVEVMARDQIAGWRSINRSGDFSNDQFLISQWIVGSLLNIETRALEEAKPAMYFAGVNGMSPERWPNVLLVDYIGVYEYGKNRWDEVSAELYALTVGLNLYMIGENCDINKEKSPLLRASTRRSIS